MTEVRFYHITRGGVATALPQLISKGLQTGRRIVVRVADDVTAEKIANDLWTFDPDTFIPHGTKSDGNAALQPVWITPASDNPNNANMLLAVGANDYGTIDNIELICDLFDGNDDANVTAARARWKTLQAAGHTLTYWQQGETGWEKKA